jgi:hypothetical protein
VTHPFHPLFGREFTIATRRRYWGDERLVFYDDQHALASIPLAWTSLAPPDPFVLLSAGRSPFRLEDLIQLAQLIHRVRDARARD